MRKGTFSDESGKRHEKGQQAVQDQSMTMEKSWVMMKDRTDKEHEEQDEACSTSEVQHTYRVGQKTGLFSEVCNSRIC